MKGMFAALAARIDAAIADASSARAMMRFTFWLIRSSILEAWRDGLASATLITHLKFTPAASPWVLPSDCMYSCHLTGSWLSIAFHERPMTKSFAAALWAASAAKPARAAIVIVLIFRSSFFVLIRRRERSFAECSAIGFT